MSQLAAVMEGADVDGMEKAGKKCLDAAEVAQQVERVMETIVAALSAMSFFAGPWVAPLIEFITTTVIPWLRRIAMALQSFGQVLLSRAAAQRRVSAGLPVNFAALPRYSLEAAPSAPGTRVGPLSPGQVDANALDGTGLAGGTPGGTPAQGTTGGTPAQGATGGAPPDDQFTAGSGPEPKTFDTPGVTPLATDLPSGGDGRGAGEASADADGGSRDRGGSGSGGAYGGGGGSYGGGGGGYPLAPPPSVDTADTAPATEPATVDAAAAGPLAGPAPIPSPTRRGVSPGVVIGMASAGGGALLGGAATYAATRRKDESDGSELLGARTIDRPNTRRPDTVTADDLAARAEVERNLAPPTAPYPTTKASRPETSAAERIPGSQGGASN